MQSSATVESEVRAALGRDELVSLSLRGPREDARFQSVRARPVTVHGELRIQFEYQAGGRTTHRNLTMTEYIDEAVKLLTAQFERAVIRTTAGETTIRRNRRGQPVVTRQAAPAPPPNTLCHDRRKRRLLPEGDAPPFLHRLGLSGADGRVLSARYDKYRQINRFLEIVDEVAGELPDKSSLRIVDFGSGKAYLTFALYDYFTRIRHRDVDLVGLDIKADVVASSNQAAHDLGFDHLRFEVGDISSYRAAEPADMVVSLHACDTATDDALARAVRWRAGVILAVPCCQHELYAQIAGDEFRPLLAHGLLKERFAALLTDALRVTLLEGAGYRVSVVEFVDAEHTPKNLMIRAVRGPQSRAQPHRMADYETVSRLFHADLALRRALVLDSGERDAGDDLSLEEKEDDEHGSGAQRACCQSQPVLRGV